ncbi:YfkD family protein [Gracilibacillus sp. YIM 98692]|uniref:YfkD family protein n=1 Tax=Gracilibacillus sp. YIM 98692 TaxID=2663532 RepID=UPI001F08B885|nr:YfkD family protein [Gracilibacillus sp. YIM 98692]
MMEKVSLSVILAFIMLTVPLMASTKADIPDYVENIDEENTSPKKSEEQNNVEPSNLVNTLMDGLNIEIENPELVQLLNESSLNPSPLAFGYRGNIYLGRWPLRYDSEESNVKWEFQVVNTNEVDNRYGDKEESVYYHQEEDKHVKGALTAKVDRANQIKQMVLNKASQQVDLPLTFHAVIGNDTKLSKTYAIPKGDIGRLEAYLPVLQEKGQITYGEVYLELKGSGKELVIKNVTKQEVGAIIPVQNHLAFKFQSKGAQ